MRWDRIVKKRRSTCLSSMARTDWPGILLPPRSWQNWSAFVTGQVESMIDEILSGVTAPNPISRGPSDTECKYCEFFIGLSQRRLQREHAAVRLRHAGGILAGT